MAFEIFTQEVYGDVYRTAAIFIAMLIVARVLYPLIKKLIHHFTRKTETTLDDEVVAALEKPIYFTILLTGVYLAITGIDYLDPYKQIIQNISWSFGILLVAFTSTGIIRVMINWYQVSIAQKTHTKIDDKLLPLLNKLVNIAIFALAVILILNVFGVEITPLVASLGIGGLAVALALQPTLSNFFAGTYVMSEGMLKTGDFIELENGTSGFIEEIGSRSTKLRTQHNFIVVIPNSKLAESIIKNYHEPEFETRIPVNVGVSYDSDLEKVEKVTLEVARKVVQDSPSSDKKHEPVIRFSEFGDSNINFRVILGVKSYPERHTLIHEFIKQLKKRYDEEGIEISYPVRKVYMKDEGKKAHGNK
ncbi:MAG: mechanosensitive ion channel family protein [Candidatus Aenigmarchaeota archaeon]|nr:mechanosensitive ion channel family protein [Candidatus Aenigmarchaeota archaeon]